MPWKIKEVNYVRIRRDGTIEVYPLDDKEPMELLKPKDILIQTEQNAFRPESSYKDLLGTVL